jgi:hypothetical protein
MIENGYLKRDWLTETYTDPINSWDMGIISNFI